MTAFDQAFSLLKEDKWFGTDLDYHFLADIVGNRRNYEQPHNRIPAIAQALKDIMTDETTMHDYPSAKTPRVFRSMPKNEWDSLSEGDLHPNHYFSPQRIVPHYYSHLWGDDNFGPRRIGEFEMPVPFDHDSVLDISGDWHNDLDRLRDPNSPEIQRIAEGSRISPEKAMDIMDYWHGAYSFMPTEVGNNRDRFNEALRNAGYDYFLHNEYASQDIRQPIWNQFRRKAAHDIHPDFDELSRQISNVTPNQMPYRSSWHVGEADSAPVLNQLEPQLFRRPDFRAYTDRELQELLFGGRADDLYKPLYDYGRDD